MSVDRLHSGLADRVALVTGASGGLGEHFAKVLSEAGARVVLTARRQERLDAIVSEIVGNGGQAESRTMDVTNADDVNRTIADIDDRMGPVSILINNAGIARSGSFLKQDDQALYDTLAVNLLGARAVAHAVTSRLVARRLSGCVVNIASILGLRVGFGHSSYAMSKAAVVQMTRSMALELGPKGIRVNALCPGFIATDINAEFLASDEGRAYIASTPAGRVGALDELTGPLMLLCSDAGSFINGIALPVDGGHLVSSL